MLLSSVPGHSKIKDYFKKVLIEDRIPHALLIVGKPGYGTMALANAFASLIQCKNNENGEACGTCSSCIKALQYIHPDIHYSYPVVKLDKIKREDTISSHFLKEWRLFLTQNTYGDVKDWLEHINALDKIANMNVAECNHIIKNLSLKTYEGKYKVQIIWASEYLGKEGNRLLKLIEEPAPQTIIILICENRNAILNTIRSRCQILSVPPLEDSEIKMYLQENQNADETHIKDIIYLSNGDIKASLNYFHQNQLNYSDDLLNWLRIAYKMDPDEVLSWNGELATRGKQEIKNFFSYALHFLREYLLGLNLKKTEELRLSDEEKNVILKMQKIIDRRKTEQLQTLFNKVFGLVDRNLSLKIMIINITFEINEILRSEVNKFV